LSPLWNCPYKDEKSAAFDIKPQRHHINEKMMTFRKTRDKGRKQ
jgi:hypothetical protein